MAGDNIDSFWSMVIRTDEIQFVDSSLMMIANHSLILVIDWLMIDYSLVINDQPLLILCTINWYWSMTRLIVLNHGWVSWLINW